MPMSRVLVVDDDGHIRDVMRFTLQQGGYQVVEAKDGAAAVTLFDAGGIDLIVLDIVMPESDGLEVCRRIRHKSRVPIIFVSSRDEELDRVLGLELGADDYICKPFSPREVVARVKVALRRLKAQVEATKSEEKELFSVDEEAERISVKGTTLDLTRTEFKLLRLLASRPGRVYPRAQLVDLCAQQEGEPAFDRVIDSHIKNLRKKIARVLGDQEVIHSVYGVGYRFEIA